MLTNTRGQDLKVFRSPLIIGIFEKFQVLCVPICLWNTTMSLLNNFKIENYRPQTC